MSVLATPGTVKRAYTRDLIQSFATKCHVRLVGSQIWRAWPKRIFAASHIDDEAIRTEIAPCFYEKDGKRTDIVVLACTHYPFLANVFRRLAPWPVDWLDPAEAIARRALSLLRSDGASRWPSPNRRRYRHLHLRQSGFLDTPRLMQGFGLESSLKCQQEPLRALRVSPEPQTRETSMPAKSKAQQKAAGAALSAKRGDTKKSELKGAAKGMYEFMSEKQLDELASTKRKGKPEHVSKGKYRRKPPPSSRQGATRGRSASGILDMPFILPL